MSLFRHKYPYFLWLLASLPLKQHTQTFVWLEASMYNHAE